MLATFTCSSPPAEARLTVSELAAAAGLQHAVRARRLHRAQTRAEVARVLDAVEHHHQRRRARLLQQLVDRRHRLGRDDRDESLMRDARGHAVQRLAGLEAQRDAQLAGAADGVGDALVAQALDHEQPVEVPRARAERFQHGVDPADEVHGLLN
jgi:hypothetical protein